MLRGLVLALSVTGALAFSAQLPVRCRLLYPCMEISLECLNPLTGWLPSRVLITLLLHANEAAPSR